LEQAVWIAFSVIAVGIGLAVISNLIISSKDDSVIVVFKESIQKLKAQCDFVCDSSVDTYLPVDVMLPAGVKLYTNDDRICGKLNVSEGKETELSCAVCSCRVNGSLDLSNAKGTFSQRKYSCYFERRDLDVQMECKG
jgi:hypothetical protein